MSESFAPDELVLLVSIGPSGEIVGGALRRPTEELVTFPLEEEHRLLTFALASEEFRSPTGEPVSATMWAGLRLQRDGRADGGDCGRCLAAPLTAEGDAPPIRQTLVFEGDLCTPPIRSMRARAFPDASNAIEDRAILARISQTFKLAWPGRCACSPSPDSPGFDGFELELLGAELEPELTPFSALAFSPAGRVNVFGFGFARTSTRFGFEFGGRPEEALGLPGDRFVVGVGLEPFDRDSKLILLDSNQTSSEVLLLSHDKLRIFPGVTPDEILVGSRGPGENPSLLTCLVRSSTLQCSESPLARQESTIREAGALGDGTIIARGDRLSLYLISPDRLTSRLLPSDSWLKPQVRSTTERLDLDPAEITTGRSLISVLGQRVFQCVDEVLSGAVVITAQMSAALVDAGQPPPEWTATYRALGLRCSGVSTRSSTTVEVFFGRGADRLELLTLDASGLPLGIAGDDPDLARPALRMVPLEGIDRPVAEVRIAPNGGLVALTADSAIFVREAGRARFTQQYGAKVWVPPSLDVVASRRSEFWLFPSGPVPELEDRLRSSSQAAIRFPVAGVLEVGERATAAAHDPARDGLWLATRRCNPACTTDLLLLSSEGRLESRLSLDDALGTECGGSSCPVLGIQPVLIGARDSVVVLLVAGKPDLLMLEGEQIRPVQIIWDDPRTTQKAENEPPACALSYSPFDHSKTRLWVMTQSDGVVWIAGCQYTLLRLSPQLRPPTAQRFAVTDPDLVPPSEPFFIPPAFAAAASCADRVVIGLRGGPFGQPRESSLWEIQEDAILRPNRRDYLEKEFRRGEVKFLSSLPQIPWTVFVNGGAHSAIHLRGRPETAELEGPALAMTQNEQGELLLGSSHGRLYLARPRAESR